MNAGRPDFAFSYTYITWKGWRIWELLLQKIPGRLLTSFSYWIEDKVTEAVEQKPEARIIEPCSQLKNVLRQSRSQDE